MAEQKPQNISDSKKRYEPTGQLPLLESFSVNMMQEALAGKYDQLCLRDQDVENIALTIARRKKANTLMLGYAGVGKTAIVEGLALKIVNNEVDQALQNVLIYNLDVASILGADKPIAVLRALLNEVEQSTDKIILFIDEIHTLVGAGANGNMDLSNVMKPALARGRVRVIGATTFKEYKNSIEKDGALRRRFTNLIIDEPSVEETVDILKSSCHYYETHHSVQFSDNQIKLMTRLAYEYITERHFPDKAFDVMDDVGASTRRKYDLNNKGEVEEIYSKLEKAEQKVNDLNDAIKLAIKSQKFAEIDSIQQQLDQAILEKTELEKNRPKTQKLIEVSDSTIFEIVSKQGKVPIHTVEADEWTKLAQLENHLQSRIIGQPDAVKAVTLAVKRSKTGVSSRNKPQGSFIFCGTTGVGKTELAKVLARYLYGTTDNIIRIDCTEYQEKHELSKLIGSPPGYVGYSDGNTVAEKIRRRPHSILLFDEIEKAHVDIFDILLPMLDEGFITDAEGQKIDCRSTYVIMTTNVGTQDIDKYHVRGNNHRMSQVMYNALVSHFKPEFINRIDDTIIFDQLEPESIKAIVNLELEKFKERVYQNLSVNVSFNSAVIDYLAKWGYDPQYGARPLRRKIQETVETWLADYVIDKKGKPYHRLQIDVIETGENSEYQHFVNELKV